MYIGTSALKSQKSYNSLEALFLKGRTDTSWSGLLLSQNYVDLYVHERVVTSLVATCIFCPNPRNCTMYTKYVRISSEGHFVVERRTDVFLSGLPKSFKDDRRLI